jgi:quinol monooxygenase YgiN
MIRLLMVAALFAVKALPLNAAQPSLYDPPMTNDRGETSFMIDIRLKPGTEDEFETVVLRAVRCSRLEPGNIMFNIHKIYGTTGRYMLYEVWRTQQQLRDHLARPYAKRLYALLNQSLEKPLSESLAFMGDFAPDIRLDPIASDPNRMADCRE